MANITAATKYFSDKPDFEYPCPTCDVGYLIPNDETFERIEPAHSKLAHEHEAWDPDWVELRFRVKCICNKKDCGEVAFVSGRGSVHQRYDYEGIPEYFEKFQIESFYPAPKLCYVPDETPAAVKDYLNKSFALYWSDIGSAANLMRSSLEALLDDLKIPKEEKKKRAKRFE